MTTENVVLILYARMTLLFASRYWQQLVKKHVTLADIIPSTEKKYIIQLLIWLVC